MDLDISTNVDISILVCQITGPGDTGSAGPSCSIRV